MLPLRKALDFAHSERHNFVPMVVYSLYTHTIHIPLLLCSCKSDEGHASFCQRRRENERLAFIHNSEVGSGGWGRGGSSCQEGDVVLQSNDYVGLRASLTAPEGQ